MPLSKDELLAKLTSAGVQFSAHEHVAVTTLEAQAQALTGVAAGAVVKNLFLKDKKARLYIISLLPSTKADLKVLSARMGLGKGGINPASDELVQEVLQVAPGSVSPLALANPSASAVTLLLDQHLRAQASLLLLPLVNTCSLAMAPSALEAALKAFGREAVYVDLEADPKIDRENPPDLAKYVPEAPAKDAAAAAGAGAAGAGAAGAAAAQPAASSSGKGATQAAPAAAAKGGASKPAAGKAPSGAPGGASLAAQHRTLSDVNARAEAILQSIAQALLGTKLEEAPAAAADSYVLTRLRADVEMQLNALRNAAYTAGYTAGKGEVVGFAEKRYA